MTISSFEGQVAIVTGAGRSLGRAYALALASQGAAVVVNDVAGVGSAEEKRADSVVAEIEAAGGRAVASYDSVQSWEGGRRIVETALERFGTVDVVINNAGFLRSAYFEDLSADQLQEVLGVHLLAAFAVTQPAWKVMRDHGYGRVVFTSSSSSFGQLANSNYAAAKSGLLGMAAALAIEGEPLGIRVNSVLPYAVSPIASDNPLVGADTPRIRAALDAMSSRRTPESVAAMVLYLASRECAVSGHGYSALAGRYARVFFGVTEGWMDVEGSATARSIADHIDAIDDVSTFLAPHSMLEEIEHVLARVRTVDSSI